MCLPACGHLVSLPAGVLGRYWLVTRGGGALMSLRAVC